MSQNNNSQIQTRPQRLRQAPVYLASPSHTQLARTTCRDYELNRGRAIDKKLEACQRQAMTTKVAAGNNVVIKLSASTYELVKSNLKTFYDNHINYVASVTVSRDNTNLQIDETWRVTNRLKNGSVGKTHKFTINFYHTKCTMLVNGKEATSTFLDEHLPKMKQSINCNRALIEQLDQEITRALQNYKNGQYDNTKNPCLSGGNYDQKHPNSTCDQNMAISIQNSDDIIIPAPSCISSITAIRPASSLPKEPTIDTDNQCKCPICQQIVTVNAKAVECTSCSNWYHYNCENLSQNIIRNIESDISLEYKCSVCTADNQEQTELKTIYTSPETRPLQSQTIKDAHQVNIPKIACSPLEPEDNRVSDKEKKLIEIEQKLSVKEKNLNKKEKDLRKMEMDYNEKITQVAARRAYIAKLETQIKELQQSNHLMKIQLAASNNSQEESTTTTSNHMQCNHNYMRDTSGMASIAYVQEHNAIKMLESKVDTIERTNRLEMQMLRDRIQHMENASISNKLKQQPNRPKYKGKSNTSARMEHQNFNKNLSIPKYANINYQENGTIHQSIPHQYHLMDLAELETRAEVYEQNYDEGNNDNAINDNTKSTTPNNPSQDRTERVNITSAKKQNQTDDQSDLDKPEIIKSDITEESTTINDFNTTTLNIESMLESTVHLTPEQLTTRMQDEHKNISEDMSSQQTKVHFLENGSRKHKRWKQQNFPQTQMLMYRQPPIHTQGPKNHFPPITRMIPMTHMNPQLWRMNPMQMGCQFTPPMPPGSYPYQRVTKMF